MTTSHGKRHAIIGYGKLLNYWKLRDNESMSKIAHYLQEHLVGEVTSATDARRHFAHDASILQQLPSLIVYPRSENDVRKTARFCWQIAERGKVIPITARGAGGDSTGAALGSGIIMAFGAHMTKVVTLDPRKQIVEIEAGINYDKLQQTLFTHGLFLPPYPPSIRYATVGGSIANNACGEKSVKYGDMLNFVEQLRVVLANGEVIETRRISKRDLSKKMGLSTFEGEIYRQLDALLDDHKELLKDTRARITAKRNAAGYNLFDVKRKDGSFDLTPLIVGSQGTLGLVTEAVLKAASHNPTTKLALLALPNVELLQTCLEKVLEMHPSQVEFVNGALLERIGKIHPNQITGILQHPAAAVLIVEFDDNKEGKQSKSIKKLRKLAEKYHVDFQLAENLEEQDNLLAIRRSVAVLMHHSEGQKRMLPVADDVAVPPSRYAEAVQKIESLYGALNMPACIWGHAGDGIIRSQPLLELAQLGERQRLFKIMDEVYKYVIELGGSVAAASGDGRMAAPYVNAMYGPEMYDLFVHVKKVFDPHNMLNPGVKLGVKIDDLKSMLRNDYSHEHRIEHMPRT